MAALAALAISILTALGAAAVGVHLASFPHSDPVVIGLVDGALWGFVTIVLGVCAVLLLD